MTRTLPNVGVKVVADGGGGGGSSGGDGGGGNDMVVVVAVVVHPLNKSISSADARSWTERNRNTNFELLAREK